MSSSPAGSASVDLKETPAKDTDAKSRVVFERRDSATPLLPPKNVKVTGPPAPLRGITSITPLPIPDMPAPPRPDFSIDEPEDIKPEETEVEEKPASKAVLKRMRSLRVPRRKYSTKGLEEDDPVGFFLAFIWWFLFIFSRVFSIALFYEFYPIYLSGVLGVHYAVMIAYLFYYAKYYDATTFFVNLWLGLIYVFSIVEYRIKFKYADKWLVFYYVFVFVQNGLMTLGWYLNADYDGFWYTYVCHAIFISMGLCLLSTITYHVILKPKKQRVYVT